MTAYIPTWRKANYCQVITPEHSLKIAKKRRNVKDFKSVAQDAIEVNSRKAVYNHIRLDEMPVGLSSGVSFPEIISHPVRYVTWSN